MHYNNPYISIIIKNSMEKNKSQTELRWNVKSEEYPENHEWLILTINRPYMLDKMRQRFIEQTNPIDEIRIRAKGKVPNTRLEYSLMSCKTFTVGPHNINWKAIYQGLISRDEELYERKNDGLLEYIEKLIKNKST